MLCLWCLLGIHLEVLCGQIYESDIWGEIWAGKTTLGVVSIAMVL